MALSLFNFIANRPLIYFNLRTHSTTTVKSTSPYVTTIHRKREVKDVSLPNFEKVECLKWSDWMMLRDVKRRLKNAEYWQYRLNLKNLSASLTLPSIVRDIAAEERLANTPLDSSVARLNNRCALTSRSRGKFYKYKLSRIVWRDMADHGMLAGPIRAKWG